MAGQLLTPLCATVVLRNGRHQASKQEGCNDETQGFASDGQIEQECKEKGFKAQEESFDCVILLVLLV